MVTKEGKIGLLLGLVFIVAIAVVLRGVHKDSTAGLQQDTNLISADTHQQATDQLINEAVRELSVTVNNHQPNTNETQNRPAADGAHGPGNQSGSAPVAVEITPTENDINTNVGVNPETAENDEHNVPDVTVRYIGNLPGSRLQYDDNAQRQVRSVIVPPSGRLERAIDQVVTISANTAENNSPQQLSKYVVREGDNLSKIAVKFYGKDQGNRLVNIDEIFKANRDKLSSIDEIWVGQELIIPAMKNAAPEAAPQYVRPADNSSENSRNNSRQSGSKTKNNIYVVEEGDSLWKIAQQKLGDGARFEEIEELNESILRNRDNLWVGLRLKIPGK